ncbi:hypothetical protein DDE18_10060 [Nocardioides gansuensis]|uniref:DUF6458 domain-containing protein n=1 Tax=Nocardioides gansuensis TaxID=2138300 RepID=A0A2T8FAF0_9ACTN|nr:DUF6458 family protein [Nocardioides gansuensis]PVG82702.1 hypothetical protein DDE18_10060 [Nocardioides gansuensis]
MGYGLGVTLLTIGLILALAVRDAVDAIDLTTVGWILVLAGLIVLAITAFQVNSRRRRTSVATTTDPYGRQATTERRTETDPPPPPAV